MPKLDRCPLCASRPMLVLCSGLPMKLCANDACGCYWGFWSWVTQIGFNGYFISYQPGMYWQTLWRWLTDH